MLQNGVQDIQVTAPCPQVCSQHTSLSRQHVLLMKLSEARGELTACSHYALQYPPGGAWVKTLQVLAPALPLTPGKAPGALHTRLAHL